MSQTFIRNDCYHWFSSMCLCCMVEFISSGNDSHILLQFFFSKWVKSQFYSNFKIREILARNSLHMLDQVQFRPSQDLQGDIFQNFCLLQKKNPTKECTMGSRVQNENEKKIHRESRYNCPKCDITSSVTPCFQIHHTAT